MARTATPRIMSRTSSSGQLDGSGGGVIATDVEEFVAEVLAGQGPHGG
jgi:hypothetical protein